MPCTSLGTMRPMDSMSSSDSNALCDYRSGADCIDQNLSQLIAHTVQCRRRRSSEAATYYDEVVRGIARDRHIPALPDSALKQCPKATIRIGSCSSGMI